MSEAPLSETDVRSAIQTFIAGVQNLAEEARRRGEIKKRAVTRPVLRVEEDRETGNIRTHTSSEIVSLVDESTVASFVRSSLSGTDVFTTFNALARDALREHPLLRDWDTGQFAERLIVDTFNDTYDPNWTQDALLVDLLGRPVPRLVEVWLDGVEVKGPPVRLSERAVLRDRTNEDLARDPRVLKGPQMFVNVRPTAVLEFREERHVMSAPNRDVIRLVRTLALFGTAAVQELVNFETRLTTFQKPQTSWRMVPSPSQERFTMTAEQGEDFERLMRHLPDSWLNADPSTLPPLEVLVAAEQFYGALLTKTRTEGRVAPAVSALEALLGENKAELSRALGQRVAVLLSLVGVEPLDVQARLKDAYGYRSKYVHGERLEGKDAAKAPAVLPKVLRDTHLCLSIYVQIRPHFQNKKAVLKALDEAMVSQARREELARLVSEKVFVPSRNGEALG